MGLWLEHRDEKGIIRDRARFKDGTVEMIHLVEVNGDGSTSAPTFTVKQAVALAKMSSHLPVESRDWVLRIGYDD